MARASLRAPNSLLLVVTALDPDVQVPTVAAIDASPQISHTGNCIAVGTVAEDDGIVQVELTELTELAPDNRELRLLDRVSLDCPAGEIRVETVYGDVIASSAVSRGRVDVKVWVNHDSEPDLIVVQY